MTYCHELNLIRLYKLTQLAYVAELHSNTCPFRSTHNQRSGASPPAQTVPAHADEVLNIQRVASIVTSSTLASQCSHTVATPHHQHDMQTAHHNPQDTASQAAQAKKVLNNTLGQ